MQGNYASLGILLEYIKNNVIDQINELASRKGIFGATEIPIPQKKFDMFSTTLINRVGDQAYFELIAKGIYNNFSTISEKLTSSNSPTNQMANFIYNQTSYDLQQTIKKNSIIEILLAIVIGAFTFVSVKGFFGL